MEEDFSTFNSPRNWKTSFELKKISSCSRSRLLKCWRNLLFSRRRRSHLITFTDISRDGCISASLTRHASTGYSNALDLNRMTKTWTMTKIITEEVIKCNNSLMKFQNICEMRIQCLLCAKQFSKIKPMVIVPSSYRARGNYGKRLDERWKRFLGNVF